MRSLSTALTTMRRSPYQAFLAVSVVTVTYIMVYIFSIAVYGANSVLLHIESQPQIIGFFELNTDSQAIDQLNQKYSKKPQVKNVTVVTQEDALAIYREENKEDPLLLELVTADILPASIEIQTYKPTALQQIQSELEQEDLIEEVSFQEDVIDSIIDWANFIRSAGIFLVSLLGITLFLNMLVIIALKTTAQKSAISIIKQLGASSGFIRRPLVIEGAVYGLLGSIFGWILALITLVSVVPESQVELFFFSPELLSIESVGYQLLAGIFSASLIGSIAAYLAASRFINRHA